MKIYNFVVFFTVYSFIPLVVFVLFRSCFYTKILKFILGFQIIIFGIAVIISLFFTYLKDSFFFIVSPMCLGLIKLSIDSFFCKYNEKLSNTFNFFQFEQPKNGTLSIHKIYNVIIVIMFAVIPPICSVFLYPSLNFIKVVTNILK